MPHYKRQVLQDDTLTLKLRAENRAFKVKERRHWSLAVIGTLMEYNILAAKFAKDPGNV